MYRFYGTVHSLHQMGFEPMRLSPEDLKSSPLDLAPALMRKCSSWGSNPGHSTHPSRGEQVSPLRHKIDALTN